MTRRIAWLSLVVPLVVSLGLLAAPAPAQAQREGPQPCGQEAGSADYGEIRVGTVVVPQRHRFVVGNVTIDTTSRTVVRGGRDVALTPKEFGPLVALLRRGGGCGESSRAPRRSVGVQQHRRGDP